MYVSDFVRLFVDILDTETDMITVKVHNELVPKINKHVIVSIDSYAPTSKIPKN